MRAATRTDVTTPIPLRSASQLADDIAAGRCSALEVTRAHLDHIAVHNPRLNALVQRLPERALEAAREADALRASGAALGPLHGVPFTVKDVIDVAGVVGAAGLESRRHHVPTHDAEVVRRLQSAGAILVGKSNCPPGGGGGETDNPVYGATRNPWDLAHSAGGSSGGEACAVAAGLSPLGVGSDSGGSLRVPAHFCGIATLKPSVGRVPHTGVFDHAGGLSDPRTQIGVLARCVADLELAWPLIAGVDGVDSGVVPMPLPPRGSLPPAGLRVALYDDDGLAAPCPATRAVIASAGQALREAGVQVVEARPPRLAEARPITERYWQIEKLTGREVLQLYADWDAFRSAQLGFLRREPFGFDAIVCPVDARAAPRLGQALPTLFNYTLPYALCGWPGAVVRAGSDAQGLPVGVQITAGAWREDIALALAAVIEDRLGGWQPPPGLRDVARAS